MAPLPEVPAAAEALASQCVDCGYLLRGRARGDRCPECGRVYDGETIVLHGWARGSHATAGNASPRVLLGVILLDVIQIFFQLVTGSLGHNSMRWVIIGFWTLPIVLMLGYRWTSLSPGLIRMWLSPRGCVQQDDVDRKAVFGRLLRLSPWVLLPLFLVVWPLTVTPPEMRGVVLVVMTAVSGAALLLVRILVVPRRRKKLATPAAMVARDAPPEEQWCAWKDVEEISVSPAGSSRWRVRVRRLRANRFTRYAIDADVECDSDTATAIHNQFETWRHGLTRPTGSPQTVVQ